MTASGVIARAMSLADLQNSKFVTFQDQQNSLFESYKDLYSEITKNDDDFYYTTYTTQVSQPNGVPLNPNEYLITLPSDFYKLRAIEYQSGTYWIPMERFAMSGRSNPASRPMYRFQGNNLWIIGWNFNGLSGTYSVRVHYYPPAYQPTFPDQPLVYGSAITAANLNSITSPFFANISTWNGTGMVNNRTYFYVQGGNTIWFENMDTQTSGQLATQSGSTNLAYYKGYLYLISGGNIYSGAYTPGSTTVTFAQVVITGTPTVLNFNIFNNTIYYSTATQTYSVALTGGVATSLAIGATSDYLSYNGYAAYINSATSGAIVVNGVSLGGTYTQAYTDGSSYIYALDTSGNLNALAISVATPSSPSITKSTVVQSDVYQIGNWSDGYWVSMIGKEVTRFWTISVYTDTDFAYPLNSNEIGEIMAYQCAIDFRRKQGQDVDVFMLRKQELYARMQENMRRDDYRPEKINNSYANRGAIPGQWGW